MRCNICKITNKELRNSIEQLLDQNDGTLGESNRLELIDKYPNHKEDIEAITDNDCSIHWNFHQSITREPAVYSENEHEQSHSLAADIHKDEGYVLYEMLNKQAATFNLISKKINKMLQDEEADLTTVLMHTTTLDFYKSLGDSIRATAREIRGMNSDVNGSKNGANDGLKAIAAAILGVPTSEDQTTKEFDEE